MTLDDLKPGLRHSATLTVSEALAVPAQPRLFSPDADMPTNWAESYAAVGSKPDTLELIECFRVIEAQDLRER